MRILLVEDSEDDVVLVRELLERSPGAEIDLVAASSLEETRASLDGAPFDVVLLDLSLPDSRGIDTVRSVTKLAGGTPIIIMTGLDDEMVAIESLGGGAQDYLVKGRMNGEGLWRAIRYAVERQRLTQELILAQKMEAVGRLAGGVAHDFNNLLTVIAGYAELMTHDRAPEEFREAVAEISLAARRGATLVRQLLAFSRHQVVQARPTDLNELVGGLGGMLARLLGENITVETVLQPALWPILIDFGQAEQILVNLSVNARDAMPNGGRLTIETANATLAAPRPLDRGKLPAGEYVRLTVRDTGSGIDPALLPRIFQPFFTTKPSDKGTGLGLAIVARAVRQSAGEIEIESHVGQGTIFRIHWPRGEDAPAKVGGTDVTTAASVAGKRILVVEDQDSVANLVRKLLERHGYLTMVADGGKSALGLAGDPETRIDLVLTDLVMPEIGGMELARKLRAVRPGVPVVFMSGYSADAVDDLVLGPTQHLLQKPFTSAELLSTVQRVLEDSS